MAITPRYQRLNRPSLHQTRLHQHVQLQRELRLLLGGALRGLCAHGFLFRFHDGRFFGNRFISADNK